MIRLTDVVVDRKTSFDGSTRYVYMSHRRKPDTVKFIFHDEINKYMWLDYLPKDLEKYKESELGELWTCWGKDIERHGGFKKREQKIRLIKDKNEKIKSDK